MQTRAEIKDRITEISLLKHKFDEQYNHIHSLMLSQKALRTPVAKLRI